MQSAILLVDYLKKLVDVICRFSVGSRALGCYLMLNGKSGNTSFYVTRISGSVRQIKSVSLERASYAVYDWEEDGSIGSVSVPVKVEAISASSSANKKGIQCSWWFIYIIVSLFFEVVR